MDKRTLKYLEILTLFICNFIGVFSFMKLPMVYSERSSPLLWSLLLTLVTLIILKALGYQRIIYFGALLFLPTAISESVIGWGLEYHYTKNEFIWSELRKVNVPRMIRYTFESLKTTFSPIEILFMALALTTGYIILNAIHVLMRQSQELVDRRGTQLEIDKIINSQIILQTKVITKTVLMTASIIGVSNYLISNINMQGLPRILINAPGLIGVILLITILWKILKTYSLTS